MVSYRVIGQPTPRTDGTEKVTGAARYTADVQLPGTLRAKALRSPLPYARIIRIDTARARELPGVHAVLTGADVRGVLYGKSYRDATVLAQERVRFIGEQVAAVAAVDEETAQRAVDLIQVEYEELPAVLDPLGALREDAPILHPEMNSYAGLPRPLEKPSNAFSREVREKGDVETGFAQADLVVENTFTMARVHQGYLEPHSCLVWIDQQDRVQVWASNKAPHSLKQGLAVALGIPPEQVCVNPVVIGGDFGGKGAIWDEPLCYFLALRTGRPVKMVMDYAEELTAANPRHPAEVRVTTGVKRDGTIVTCDIEGYFNTGAYAAFVPLGFLPGPRHAVGPYRIPDARVRAYHVYTNKVPAGHMRGPGEPQAIFAMESHVDVIARTLGLDPAEVRLRNVIREGDANALGELYHDLHGAETIEAALEASGYHAPPPAPDGPVRYGRGVAIGERAPGGGQTHAAVTFRPDGSVVVHTSIFDQGSGTYTTIRQMAADVLGMSPERIDVEVWDTPETGFDSGAGASRNSRMASEAVHEAARAARGALFALAAELQGWPQDRIALEDTVLRRTDTGERAELSSLLARARAPVTGSADFDDTTHAHVTAFTVQVAEVAVDTETGQVRLLRFTSVHDAGRVLNPMGHEGQVRGGAMQGIGFGLMEELAIADGRVTTPSFADYKVPSMADIPQMQAIAIESDGGIGPFNIKGIGENPVSPAAPAIANAIEDAVGVRITDLPITAERVYRALRAKNP
ncbi:MAG: xanthine dehydrogenase family protein molybdopterin-binding subunit [Acidobacteria bacterium]|nr:xanthine dehydrogenase family protein molybdopterin-binding subunit [Acidobacteriota bacterium]